VAITLVNKNILRKTNNNHLKFEVLGKKETLGIINEAVVIALDSKSPFSGVIPFSTGLEYPQQGNQ
jgi:hypothetical protein